VILSVIKAAQPVDYDFLTCKQWHFRNLFIMIGTKLADETMMKLRSTLEIMATIYTLARQEAPSMLNSLVQTNDKKIVLEQMLVAALHVIPDLGCEGRVVSSFLQRACKTFTFCINLPKLPSWP
jgi:hypothetical protein